MKTRIYHALDLEKANVQTDIKETFLRGDNVVFPTETVYGIGAYALSEIGIKNIYRVKGRPSDNPLIMHIHKKEDIFKHTKNHQPYVKKLINHFWPGPLTLVMEKQEHVPKQMTGGLNTVGLRMPNHPVALKVIEIAGVPICAPSANLSGRPSSTMVEHVIEDFLDRVDIIIDGGQTTVGLESTVLDVTQEIPMILRPGSVTKAMLEQVIGQVLEGTDSEQPRSPGTKYRHYAPKGQLTIVEGSQEKMIAYIQDQIEKHHLNNERVGVICTKDLRDEFKNAVVFHVGDPDQEEEIVSNLFPALRKMDQYQIEYIYVAQFAKGTYEVALKNRLLKAANYQVIQLT
ncbi:MAG: L-threonylcarbamoyladenylate synthase [Acholeplasmataceae bacterium]|nr:L-threonylcarbamoyladenylate synthase [Acholeplasmataceae bacterium]